MAKVAWADPAIQDLDAIADYIALDKPEAARRLVRRVLNAVRMLQSFPKWALFLQNCAGIGNSVEDCLYKARWGMEEHVSLVRERNLAAPAPVEDPKVVIQNPKRVSSAA
jgi:plasmid stabilization system protein ParE